MSVLSSARVRAINNSTFDEVVVPYRLRLFDAPEYRMNKGWPTAVPPFDIRSRGLANADGYTVDLRPNPTDVTTGASIRWIANTDTFSTDNLSWKPFFSNSGEYTWYSSPDWLPTLVEDYTYTIKHERFTASGLNFSHFLSKHMWGTFPLLDGAPGYTILMVGSMNSVYTNDSTGGYQAIIGSGYPTLEEGSFTDRPPNSYEVRLRSGGLEWVSRTGINLLSENTSGGPPIASLMTKTAPFYLAVTVQRPTAVFHVGGGPSSMKRTFVLSGDKDATFTGDLVLGRALNNTLHCPDMFVMDLSIYGDTLSGDQIRSEVTKLSSTYGAS